MSLAAVAAVLVPAAPAALADETVPPVLAVRALGGPYWTHWSGITPAEEPGAITFKAPQGIDFRLPDGPRGFYQHGFRPENDGTIDLRPYYGVRIEVALAAPETELTISLRAARRKIYAVRAATGTEAIFLTLIEPYESKRVVKSASASGPDKLRVDLADGRVQEITITGLSGNSKNLSVALTESRSDKAIRTEDTVAASQERSMNR